MDADVGTVTQHWDTMYMGCLSLVARHRTGCSGLPARTLLLLPDALACRWCPCGASVTWDPVPEQIVIFINAPAKRFSRLQDMTFHVLFFFIKSIQIYGIVVKEGSSELCDLGSIPAVCGNSLQPLGHFVWHWASQCTDLDMHAFVLLCSLYFFPLGFSQWRSRADRVLTFQVNINTGSWLQLLGSSWSLARGPN